MVGLDLRGAGGYGIVRLGFAARRAAVRKTGLAGPELELFTADGADFDRERHCVFILMESRAVFHWREICGWR